eukprot:364850-Chlamydomonas_euryale.AAC.4
MQPRACFGAQCCSVCHSAGQLRDSLGPKHETVTLSPVNDSSRQPLLSNHNCSFKYQTSHFIRNRLYLETMS